jgi:hypothetical protein
MEPQARRILRIHRREARLEHVVEFLGAVEYAYNGMTVFEQWVDAAHREKFALWPSVWPGYVLGPRPRALRSWPPAEECLRSGVLVRDRVFIRSVTDPSPGSLDLLGKTFAVEAIVAHLEDRRKRKNGRATRDGARTPQWHFESAALRLDVVRKRVAVMEELGVSSEMLAPLLNELVERPLERLDRSLDNDVINGAEFLDEA